jgi:hypothetical protein
MTSRRYQKYISLTLLALMLVVQTAAAGHGVEHQSLDHTEFCQAFVTADHAPAIELEHLSLDTANFPEPPLVSHSLVINQSFHRTHRARAPPQH